MLRKESARQPVSLVRAEPGGRRGGRRFWLLLKCLLSSEGRPGGQGPRRTWPRGVFEGLHLPLADSRLETRARRFVPAGSPHQGFPGPQAPAEGRGAAVAYWHRGSMVTRVMGQAIGRDRRGPSRCLQLLTGRERVC